MTAIFDGPAAFGPLAGPLHQLEMASRGGRHGALTELASIGIDHDHGVGRLVRIGPECHHLEVSFGYGDSWTGRWTCLSWGEATLLSSHTDRSMSCPVGGTSSRTKTACGLHQGYEPANLTRA